MSYGVHIQRADGASIGLADWSAAVAGHADVRLAESSKSRVVNPKTGMAMEAPSAGLAEVKLPSSAEWVPAFRWFEGRVSTNAPHDFDSENNWLRVIMRDLATVLGAQIVGDGGEIYR